MINVIALAHFVLTHVRGGATPIACPRTSFPGSNLVPDIPLHRLVRDLTYRSGVAPTSLSRSVPSRTNRTCLSSSFATLLEVRANARPRAGARWIGASDLLGKSLSKTLLCTARVT
jgi:hypothetical protein